MIRSLLSVMLALAAASLGQTAGQTTRPGASTPQQPSQPPSPPVTAPEIPPPGAAPQATPAAPPADTAAKVEPTAAVITIQGVCSSSPAKRSGTTATAKPASASSACKTEITKAQFEKLLKAVNPSSQAIPPAMRRNLAQAFVELMTFNQAAQKAGIDKDPNFLEVMRLVRMRTLQDFYRRSLEEKYRNPPSAEIEAYYNQNLAKYEEVKLSRIFIPAKNPATPNKDDWEKKAGEAANDVHDRAAKGEDFEKLQKEAYTTLGMTITPPTTSMGTRRRGMLAANEEQDLFALKAGEVSKLETGPSGYIIYKVESKDTLPMERVKDEISRELFRQKMDRQLKAVTSGAHPTYNDKYFGPATAAGPPAGTHPKTGPAGEREPQGEKEREQAPKPATAPSSSTAPATQKPPK